MALQCRALISNELTSNPVNPGPLMWIRGALGESISYALQCRVPVSNALTINPVNPGPSISVPLILCIQERVLAMPCNVGSLFPMSLPIIQ